MDATPPQSDVYPDMRDPRVIIAVARPQRAALAALWALAERLTQLLVAAREPLIAQIKLAWWRDMVVMLASDPDALPKGEPLLGELSATWRGRSGLEALVDAAEQSLLAEGDGARQEASAAFGNALFGLSGGIGAAGRRWGLLWGALVQQDEPRARALLAIARAEDGPVRGDFAGQKSLLMLDRWAAAIAKAGGERRWRSEALLLLRLGMFGR